MSAKFVSQLAQLDVELFSYGKGYTPRIHLTEVEGCNSMLVIEAPVDVVTFFEVLESKEDVDGVREAAVGATGGASHLSQELFDAVKRLFNDLVFVKLP